MKKIIVSIVLVFGFCFHSSSQELAPYIKIGESSETINQISDKVIAALKEKFIYCFRQLQSFK